LAVTGQDMKHRPNELVRDAVDVLVAHGLTPAISNGGKHIKIAWVVGGSRHLFTISHRPRGARVRANSRATLRRLVRQSLAPVNGDR
jgi:hypothetical protein